MNPSFVARSRRSFWPCALAAGLSVLASAPAFAAHRIVSTDGITTETLFALGAAEQVVARDSGSIYPEVAQALPDIGLGHQISPEAILRLRPTLVVGRDRPMSQPAFQVLESAGLKVLRLPSEPGLDVARQNIRTLAELLKKEAAGEAIVATLDTDIATLEKRRSATKNASAPKVLVVYLRPNATLIMGEDSNATALARLAGAQSALPGVNGYRPLNAEAVVQAGPEIILCYKNGLESVGGVKALYRQPGIAETPAARNKRIVAMDDLLLGGFGPRSGKALLELHHALFNMTGPYTGQ
jgi:iron complex transport system substrate-binding protein